MWHPAGGDMADQRKRYWLSFDLGLRGDYGELYAWLDHQEANECGDGVAAFKSEKSRDTIKTELGRFLDVNRNPRIYLITMHEGGRFLFGRRKVAPWTGFAQTSTDSGVEK
jgi:hypothetical protein